MASRKKKKSRSVFKLSKKSSAVSVLVIILAVALGIFYKFFPEHFDFLFGDGDIPTKAETEQSQVLGNAEIHFIDVGQGDGMLVRTPEGDVVIDAGPSSSEDDFVEYLRAQKVSTIEYLVLTHPHSDHIGGADAVLEEFDVKRVILPDTDCTTSVYMKVMSLIEKEGSEVIISKVMESYSLGAFKMPVRAPNGIDYEGYNNYSVVIRAEYGDTSVLFTGDAEKISEKEMLQSVPLDMIDCDILKVGHHGSSTSTIQSFFSIVSPKYAVISCAKNNEYGHPHKETNKTLSELTQSGNVYRTDISGNIVFTTNGTDFTVKCEK